MLYSPNPSERRDTSHNNGHRSKAEGENGAVLEPNPAGTRIVGFIEAESPLCYARAAEISVSYAFKQPSGSCRAA